MGNGPKVEPERSKGSESKRLKGLWGVEDVVFDGRKRLCRDRLGGPQVSCADKGLSLLRPFKAVIHHNSHMEGFAT